MQNMVHGPSWHGVCQSWQGLNGLSSSGPAFSSVQSRPRAGEVIRIAVFRETLSQWGEVRASHKNRGSYEVGIFWQSVGEKGRRSQRHRCEERRHACSAHSLLFSVVLGDIRAGTTTHVTALRLSPTGCHRSLNDTRNIQTGVFAPLRQVVWQKRKPVQKPTHEERRHGIWQKRGLDRLRTCVSASAHAAKRRHANRSGRELFCSTVLSSSLRRMLHQQSWQKTARNYGKVQPRRSDGIMSCARSHSSRRASLVASRFIHWYTGVSQNSSNIVLYS